MQRMYFEKGFSSDRCTRYSEDTIITVYIYDEQASC